MLELFCGHEDFVTGISYLPDRCHLASVALDRGIRVWRLGGGEPQPRPRGHTDRVTCLAFTPDSRLLVSAAEDGTVRLWNPLAGEQIQCLQGRAARLEHLVLSSDGRFAATAGSGRTFPSSDLNDYAIHVWDLSLGRLAALLVGHEIPVLTLSFSAAGDEVYSTTYDETNRTWSVATAKCLRATPAQRVMPPAQRDVDGIAGPVTQGSSDWAIRTAPGGAVRGWLPIAPRVSAVPSDASGFAAAIGSHLYVFRIEGGT